MAAEVSGSIGALRELWFYINPRRKKQLYFLFLLMLIASATEILTIGSFVPFLGIINTPNKFQNFLPSKLLSESNFFYSLNDNYLFFFGIFFGFSILLASFMRLLLLKFSSDFSFKLGGELGMLAYRKILYQDYKAHISRNSNDITNSVTNKTNLVIYNILMPTLGFFSNFVILIAIVFILFFIHPLAAFSVFSGFGLIYIIITLVTSRIKKINGASIAKESTNVFKFIQEGIGGIRDVIIDNSQETFCDLFAKADSKLKRAQAINQFLGQSPRYVIEALGMLFIIFLACLMTSTGNNLSENLPILGAIALGMQRLLPIMQQMYSSFSSVQTSEASLRDLLSILNQKQRKLSKSHLRTKINFNSYIQLKNVNFSYDLKSRPVLRDINLKIDKGDKVGIVGASGSGKSTLLDILMGLLEPTSGNMIVDNIKVNYKNHRAWMANISHVPQNIFLYDSSILENIILGSSNNNFDINDVKKAAQQAHLEEYIDSLPGSYSAFVGEHGKKLSGGQRQRIGIARALFRKSKVLILDEATSALDISTENFILKSISKLDKNITIIIVTHRISALKGCNKIYQISNSKIKKIK